MVTRQHEITARYAGPEDYDAINSVFNESFQQNRSLKEFYWKFRSSPAAGKVPVAVVGLIDAQIVGVFGLLPHRLRVADEVIDAIQVVDVCVLPQFRETGVNRATLSLFLQTASEYGQLAFGFPGDFYAAMGLERLGYKLLTTLVTYEWGPERCSPDALSIETPGVLFETTTTIPDDWAPFFGNATQPFEITTERTTEYLCWRYRNFPHRRFAFLSARSVHGLEGLAVIGLHAATADNTVWIYEFVAKRPAVVFSLLRYLLRSYALSPPRRVWYWCTAQAAWQEEMKSIGFHKCEHGLNRVVGVTLADANDRLQACFRCDAWHLTLGDTDL